MAQTSVTVTLTNGSSVVVCGPTDDLSALVVPAKLVLTGIDQTLPAAKTTLPIQSFSYPSGGPWHLNLAANFANASIGPVTAKIHTSFTPNGFPLFDTGDTAHKALLNDSADAFEAGMVTLGNVITSMSEYGTLLQGADPTGISDSTAAFQAIHDSMPAGGGKIVVPYANTNYRIDGTVNVSKPILWGGNGAGPLVASPTQGTIIKGTSATAPIFSMSVDGCAFYNLFAMGVHATPTAGALLYFAEGGNMRVVDCNLLGGWQGIEVVNGQSWKVRDCDFYGHKKYGFKVANVATPDGGDQSISGCVFSTGGGTQTSSAAIYQESGGGLKVVNSKVNGPAFGAGGYSYGIWVNMPDNAGTSDLLLTNNSIENVALGGIAVGNKGPSNGGVFRNIAIVGGQISYTATGVILGLQSGTVAYNVGDFLVSEVIMAHLTTGVHVGPTYGGRVGRQYFSDVVHPVVLDASAQAIFVDAQDRLGLGYLIENASGSCLVDWTNKSIQPITTYPGPQVVYRCAVPVGGGGRISITATGVMPGVGGFSITASREFYWNGTGNVTLATLGTDTNQGIAPTSTALAFDVSTVPGEIQITQQLLVAAGFNAKLYIRAEGALTSLKIGP